jgi:hypothetical protein
MPALLIISLLLNIALALGLYRAVRNYHGAAQVLFTIERELGIDVFRSLRKEQQQ